MGVKEKPVALERYSWKKIEGSRTSHHERSFELTGILPEKKERDREHERERMGSSHTYQRGEEKKTRILEVELAPEVDGGGWEGCRPWWRSTEKKRKRKERETVCDKSKRINR